MAIQKSSRRSAFQRCRHPFLSPPLSPSAPAPPGWRHIEAENLAGDGEGAFFLGRLQSKAEAEAIRYHCGIPKKRELSEQELEREIAPPPRLGLSLRSRRAYPWPT
jgi:hypothetical protein